MTHLFYFFFSVGLGLRYVVDFVVQVRLISSNKNYRYKLKDWDEIISANLSGLQDEVYNRYHRAFLLRVPF